MPEYVMLYRNTADAREASMGSPERAQQNMQKWRSWFQELQTKGELKNIGQPLEEGGRLLAGKKKVITDGPYAETKDLVGGYSLIEARDLDHAAKIASGCPVLDNGGSVEVRQVRKMDL
jgi:hypothetical protein